MMLDYFFIAFALVTFLASCYFVGAFLVPLTLPGLGDTFDGMLRFGVGAGIFILYIFCLGHFGALRRENIVLFIIAAILFQKRSWPQFAGWLKGMSSEFHADSLLAPERLLFIASLIFSFVLLVVPETGNDALCYQLHIPKLFVRYHATRPLPMEINSYMPFGMNYLYAVGLLFGKVAVAKSFHWIMAVLTGISLLSFVRRVTGNSLWGWLSATAWMVTPAVLNQITSTYVDAAAAFYVFLAFFLLLQFFEAQDPRFLFFVGFCAGMTISIKIITAAFIAPFWILWFIRNSVLFRKKIFLLLCFFLSGAFLACGYWFVRNAMAVGNPVFPYFGHFFGTADFSDMSRYLSIGLSRSLIHFIVIPLYLTFKPAVFGWNHWLGPCYLLLLPFVLWGVWKNGAVRLGGIFLLLYSGGWFLLAQSVRYLVPALPLYLLIGFWGLSDFLESRPKLLPFVRLGFFAVYLGLFGLGVYHYRFDFKFLTGSWTEDQYLRSLERSYPVTRWMKGHLPRTAKIFLVDEIRQFYFEQLTERERFLFLKTDYGKTDPSTWIAFLKKHGYSYVLVMRPARGPIDIRSLRTIIWDKLLREGKGAEWVADIPSENIREERVKYRIFKIL